MRVSGITSFCKGRAVSLFLWTLPTAFALLVSLFAPSPASASTAIYNDPSPCSTSVNDGVCISQVSADYTKSMVTLNMNVGKATDPMVDPTWENADADDSWLINVDGQSNSTYTALATRNAVGDYFGVVIDVSRGTQCTNDVVPSYSLASNRYSIRFPASCIGNPSTISVQAILQYGVQPGGLFAVSPGEGTCCTVASDPPKTTVTTLSTPPSTSDPQTTSTTSTTSTAGGVVTDGSSTTQGGGSPTVGSSQLAFTGARPDLPILAAIGTGLVCVGTGARRRLLRRSK